MGFWPELGRYALEVNLAYAGGLALLTGLILWVWWRGRRVRAALARIETRAKGARANEARANEARANEARHGH